VKERIAEAAAALVSMVERDAGVQLGLVDVRAVGGVGVVFFRAREATTAEEEALVVLVDEEAPGEWEALGASFSPPGGSRHVSVRPSERGDWIVAVTGSAPTDARVAVIDFGGAEHRVPVVAGFYAFAERVAKEPAQPPPTKPVFERDSSF
jgi:hypothetical protein